MQLKSLKIAMILITLGIASGTQAAAYIKFDGVDGESKVAETTGQATGKRQHQPVRTTSPTQNTNNPASTPARTAKPQTTQPAAGKPLPIKPASLKGIEPDEID